MTYFNFLLVFVFTPIIVLLALTYWDMRHGQSMAGFQNGMVLWGAIFAHVILALVYTTPWDNYLVATRVWAYDPKLVSGVLFGYVPLEEYTFFVLETLLSALWWAFLARRLPPPTEFRPSRKLRLVAFGGLSLVWLVALGALYSGWQSATYLAITLAWALPAIASQLIVGADILWHYSRLVALSILPMAVYLSTADALAIASGTWTINPIRSSGIFIGALPVEEAVFFVVTNILVVFGMTLLLAVLSRQRLVGWRAQIQKART
jgi:lycopene cyclase domain-containing protein